ncbi:MAG: TolB family protein [Solirubrobacterales bacterium]
MPPKKKFLKPLVTLSALCLLLALPAAASANIAFVRGFANQTVYTANDNGGGIKRVAKGGEPHLSPDGASLIYRAEGPGHRPEMKLTTVGGGAGKTLMVNWQEPFQVRWSPNSEFVLALRGGELGRRNLVLITVATGAQKVLARGYFTGFSFDPEGKEVVYGKANNGTSYPPKSNIFRVSAAGGKAEALTHDNLSEFPLWGPTGQIVFVKLLEGDKRKYAPKNELFLMNPNGKGVKRLTHTNVGQLLQGLFPTEWSANGNRLLAQFEGQDTTYAVGVNVRTGGQRPILEATEQGLVGVALSPNGQTVYGGTGGFEPRNGQAVVSVPWSGGKPRTLVRNALLPSFSF